MSGNYFKRLFALTLSILFLMTAWQMLPLIQELIIMQNAQPRAITPRGDLAEIEKTTIELFNKTKNSVVYISTAKTV